MSEKADLCGMCLHRKMCGSKMFCRMLGFKCSEFAYDRDEVESDRRIEEKDW